VGVRRTIAALSLVLGFACHAWAGPPTETLDQTLKNVNRLLDDPTLREKPPQLLAAIRKVVIDSFDVRQAASLALGREWHVRSSTERDEFVRLFGDLLEHAYVSRIASRVSAQRGLAIRYLEESVEGDQATVTAAMESRDGSEIPLVYRMIRLGSRWAVYDVLIDGVSLVVNYRAQLHRTIRLSSYQQLVALLKAKLGWAPTVATAEAETPGVAPIAAESRVGASTATVVERDAGADRDRRVDETARRVPPAPAPSASRV